MLHGTFMYNGWQLLSGTRGCLLHPLAPNDTPIAARDAMSAAILSIISRLPQLRGSVRSSAQRFAFWANPQGICQKSYTFLAKDRHIHRSTALRHVAALVSPQEGEGPAILEKTVIRLRHNRCAINVYRFASWVMALVHERAGSSRLQREQPSREKKSIAQGMPTPPMSFDELRQACREVQAAVRSP